MCRARTEGKAESKRLHTLSISSLCLYQNSSLQHTILVPFRESPANVYCVTLLVLLLGGIELY